MKEYEMTIIVSNQLPEAEQKALGEKYQNIMTEGGGQVIRSLDWGSKKLAYPISGEFKGRYLHWDLLARPDQLQEAERLMRIDGQVLRYMSICLGGAVDVNTRREELASAEAMAAKQVRLEGGR